MVVNDDERTRPMDSNDTVTTIVILLADGRVARLDPNPLLEFQLDAVMAALGAVAMDAAEGGADS
jgi:hypothetical protein